MGGGYLRDTGGGGTKGGHTSIQREKNINLRLADPPPAPI